MSSISIFHYELFVIFVNTSEQTNTPPRYQHTIIHKYTFDIFHIFYNHNRTKLTNYNIKAYQNSSHIHTREYEQKSFHFRSRHTSFTDSRDAYPYPKAQTAHLAQIEQN